MPVTTKHKKVKLPFFEFQVPVGWKATPLTPAQKKKRRADKEKARQAAAKAAQKEIQEHEKAKRAAAAKAAPAKSAAQPQAAPAGPRSTVGAAVMPKPGRAAPTKKPTGKLCGQRTADGGTCKRVVTTVPCPKHPQGRPAGGN